jgi:hypothetical protein
MMTFEATAQKLPAVIANLDLGGLGRKLLDDDAFEADRRNGERLWDAQRVERALHEYKQFLALMAWHPEAALVPSDDIDEVWHTHVLNTARYQADCQAIFGHFQHHLPSSGESEEVLEEHQKGRQETMQLFEEAFGAVPESYDAAVNRRCRRCGRIEARRCGRIGRRCGRQ